MLMCGIIGMVGKGSAKRALAVRISLKVTLVTQTDDNPTSTFNGAQKSLLVDGLPCSVRFQDTNAKEPVIGSCCFMPRLPL